MTPPSVSETPARPGGGAGKGFPWSSAFPLMLAPMQGLTNRGLRRVMEEISRPDTLFTEFVRVRPGSGRPVSAGDLAEISSVFEAPQVAQLIGRRAGDLAAAAEAAVAAGAVHLNLNMGCPFGRMTANSGGGALLREPGEVREILAALRPLVPGTLSVKTRAGFEDPGEIFAFIDIFAAAGVDFLVLHPRTVAQRYRGEADHRVTARVAAAAPMPVIANGDIRTAEDAARVRDLCRPAGLMLGRGAISDPLLFERIRGRAPADPPAGRRAREAADFIRRLHRQYAEMFCGERQALVKLKAVVSHIRIPGCERPLRKLLRAGNLSTFFAALERLAAAGPAGE